MGRFMYQHFGNGVPRRIEVEYNKMLRHEQYLEERDAEYLAQSVSYEDVQDVIADPASLPINSIEAKKSSRHNARLAFLPVALEMLRCDYPEGYRLILDYYYSNKKVTLLYLAAKYGLTVNKVYYRMQIARDKLRDYIIMHENSR